MAQGGALLLTTSALPPVSAASESLAKAPLLSIFRGALALSFSSRPARCRAFLTLVTSWSLEKGLPI